MSAHAEKADDAWCVASVEASHFYHVEPGSLVLMPKHGGSGSRRLIESDASKPLAVARWAEWHGVRHVAFGDLERVALFQSFRDVVSSCLDSGVGLLVSTKGIVPAESRNALFQVFSFAPLCPIPTPATLARILDRFHQRRRVRHSSPRIRIRA